MSYGLTRNSKVNVNGNKELPDEVATVLEKVGAQVGHEALGSWTRNDKLDAFGRTQSYESEEGEVKDALSRHERLRDLS